MRILIVDDESLIRMDLRDILESEQHEVVGEACNGVEAIMMCKDLQPDAVLRARGRAVCESQSY